MTRVLFYILFIFVMISCSENSIKTPDIAEGYNHADHMLELQDDQYSNDLLEAVIKLSGIRKEGYGVLLNINKVASNAEIDSLKLKLQKLDINAIHSFQVFKPDSLPNHLTIAIKNSKFIWLLGDGNESKAFTDFFQKELFISKDSIRPLIIY